MKKIILFYCLFCLASYLHLQSQNGIVSYGQKIIVPDSKSSQQSKFSDYYNKERKKMNESSKNVEYILSFNVLESTFEPEEILSVDGADNDVEYAILHVGGDGVRHYSSKTNISLWAHDVFGEDVIVVDTINSQNWSITNETKIIGKYKVIKATKKKIGFNKKPIEIIAWFTPEIPNNYGPIGYYGLPGLILEIQERDFIIYAKKIKFKKNPLTLKKPSKGKRMSQDEYAIYVENAAKAYIKK